MFKINKVLVWLSTFVFILKSDDIKDFFHYFELNFVEFNKRAKSETKSEWPIIAISSYLKI